MNYVIVDNHSTLFLSHYSEDLSIITWSCLWLDEHDYIEDPHIFEKKSLANRAKKKLEKFYMDTGKETSLCVLKVEPKKVYKIRL